MRHALSRKIPVTPLAVGAVLALALSACGGEPEPPEQEPTPEETASTSTPEPTDEDEPDPEATGEDPTTEPTEEDAGDDLLEADEEPRSLQDTTELPPGGTSRAADADLPGDLTPMYFSEPGLADVVFVEHDDVLHVRALPGAEEEIVGEYPPVWRPMLAGREVIFDGGWWAEVELADGYGWVGVSYLAYVPQAAEGNTEDYSDVPPAENPDALAESVGVRTLEAYAEDPLPEPRWTIAGIWATDYESHDTRSYIVDVTGPGDDSVGGQRLNLTVADEGEGWSVTGVSTQPICLRGLSEDDLCL